MSVEIVKTPLVIKFPEAMGSAEINLNKEGKVDGIKRPEASIVAEEKARTLDPVTIKEMAALVPVGREVREVPAIKSTRGRWRVGPGMNVQIWIDPDGTEIGEIRIPIRKEKS